MEQVSDRWNAAIRKSHTVVSYVDAVSPTGRTARLLALDGAVQVDRSSAQRRRCSVKCIDPEGALTANELDSILTPYGTELRPYRGIKYADSGIEEVVPLGVFRLAKVSVSDSNTGTPDISLEAFDLSRTVSRDKFIAPYTVASGANVVDAIKTILARTFPDLGYDAVSTSVVTTAPIVYDVGNDPWDAVSSLALSIGAEIYFDTRGKVVIAPPLDIEALPSPDFTYVEGQGCTLLDLGKVLTDEPGYNGVVVTGESPGDELPPVRAVVWDNDPASPTYHLGPYGENPMFITNQIVKTEADALAAAASILQGELGFSSELSITATVNPALDCGDVVQVTRARVHVNGLYAIDALNIPMNVGGTQSLTLRQKRSVPNG